VIWSGLSRRYPSHPPSPNQRRELKGSQARNERHPPPLNFPNLHDIARHIFHANETLEVARHTLQSLIDEQARFRAEHADLMNTNGNRGTWIHTAQRAHFVAKQLHSLMTRSQSLSERLRNEINLAFNLVSQKDSAMMKTVAVVSMVYLPGTFISVCSSPARKPKLKDAG
jgi:Mg2+ and Co2+ transporter CorA